jgi:hypothetical protein
LGLQQGVEEAVVEQRQRWKEGVGEAEEAEGPRHLKEVEEGEEGVEEVQEPQYLKEMAVEEEAEAEAEEP